MSTQMLSPAVLLRAAIWGAFAFAAATFLLFFLTLFWNASLIELMLLVVTPAAAFEDLMRPLLHTHDLWRSLPFDAAVNACLGAILFVALRLLRRLFANTNHENANPPR